MDQLDPTLVRRAMGEDREAFQGLVERTWSIVFLFIQQRVSDRERARDLAQETFLQAYNRRATLRSGRSFLAWLLTIASRKVIDSHRQRGARPEVRLPDLEVLPLVDSHEGPEDGAERSEQRERLAAALSHLGDRYRAVLILRYWSGLTPGQIARLLGEPEGTIRNRIFRAHLQIRERMESPAATTECEKR